MSTARVSARALRALTSTSKTSTRPLSITGSATFSSLLTSDKPTGGRSTAPRLPISAQIPIPDTNESGKPARHFNTSRSLKANKDSSTIDFMYIPDFDAEVKENKMHIRVPILPGQEASDQVKKSNTEAETPVFIPTVSTVSDDGTHVHAPSAVSDMTSGDHPDFQSLASSVASSVKSSPTSVEGESMTKQILRDVWEDIVALGGKQGVKA